MKKKAFALFAVLLSVTMLLGPWSMVATAIGIERENISFQVASDVTLSDGEWLSASGAKPVINGTHGGHQRRMVRTSHGTYVAYLSDEMFDDTDGTGLQELSLIKIDSDGSSKVIYQDMKPYETSSVYVFCDEEENVYMTTFYTDKWDSRQMYEEWVTLRVFAVDKETDEVTDYSANIKSKNTDGWGYSTPVYDPSAGKIYALMSGGAQGDTASFCWFIFDMETMTWEPEQYQISTPERNSYMYAFPDKKGGFFLVANQNRWKEKVEGSENITFNDWVFDQLNFIYVPDAYQSSYTITAVAPADWSRLMTENLVPNNECNQHGDVYIDRDGYLHMLYLSSYEIANDKVEGVKPGTKVEKQAWHKVFDVSDPANISELYSEKMFYMNGEENDSYYRARMTQTTDGQLYIFAIEDHSKLMEVWKVMPVKGSTLRYDYELVTSKKYELKSHYTMDLAGISNGSLQDNVVEMMYGTNLGGVCEYTYLKADLNPSKLLLKLDNLQVICTDADGKKKTLEGGEFTFELINAQGATVQTSSNLADGTVVFDELPFYQAGSYQFTIRQIVGTDSSIQYDTEEIAVAVVISGEGNSLSVESLDYTKLIVTNSTKGSGSSGSESVSESESSTSGSGSSSKESESGASDEDSFSEDDVSESDSGSKGSVDTGGRSLYWGLSSLVLAAGCTLAFLVKKKREKDE